MPRIDLADFTSPDIDILSGRDKGEWARSQIDINNWDKAKETVVVYSPHELVVTTSFYLGLFSDTIESYGEKDFRDKYTFEGKDITNKIEFCIDKSIKKSSPF